MEPIERFNEVQQQLKKCIREYIQLSAIVIDDNQFSRQDRNLIRSSTEHLMHYESCVEEISKDVKK